MTALILIATFIFLFFAGYWFMERLDHALHSGVMHPFWDSEGECISILTPSIQKKAS